MIQQCRETQRGSNFIDSDITPGCRNESYPPPLGRYSVRGTCRPGTLFSGQAGIRILITSGAIILLLACACFAYTDTQIADAIYKAENSKTHPYGILQHYKHTTPRQACINTIKHARRDFNGKGDFISFLGSRYCPVGALNDPRGLNKNWIKNVNMFLERR